MGQQSITATTTTDTTVTTTTETVVATLSGLSTPRKRDITLSGWAQMTTGTNTTGLTVRIRRGTGITGTLVGEANIEQIEAAAGSIEGIDITALDLGIDMSNGTYVLTIQQTAASADGSCVQAALTASWSD